MSSRARSSASESSITRLRAEGVAHLGPVDRDLGDALRGLVADVLVVAGGLPVGARAGCSAPPAPRSSPRSAWRPYDSLLWTMADLRGARAPRPSGRWWPTGASLTYAELDAPRRALRAQPGRARGRARATAVAIDACRRASTSRAAPRAAASWARCSAPLDTAARPARAQPALVVDGAARRRPRGARSSSRERRCDPDAVAHVIHTSGTTGAPKPVELTYGNHRGQRARRRPTHLGVEPERPLALLLPLLPRRRPVDPDALGDLRHDRGRRTSASTPSGCARRSRRGEVTLVSLVPTMLARLLDGGPARARPTCGPSLLGGGPVPRRPARVGGRDGHPGAPTYGMTETCSQVVAGSPGRALARRRARASARRRRDARPRPDGGARRARADGWLHTGDRGRARRGRLPAPSRAGSRTLIVTGGENVAAPRWRRRCSRTRPWPTPAVVGRAGPGVGRGGGRLRGAARDAADAERRCAPGAARAWRRTRSRSGSWRGRAAAQRRGKAACDRLPACT